jgi:hypothetical protein
MRHAGYKLDEMGRSEKLVPDEEAFIKPKVKGVKFENAGGFILLLVC